MCGRARGWNEFARCSRNRYFHLKPRVSSLDATYVTRSRCGISDDLSSKELVVTRSTVRKEVEGSTSSTPRFFETRIDSLCGGDRSIVSNRIWDR